MKTFRSLCCIPIFLLILACNNHESEVDRLKRYYSEESWDSCYALLMDLRESNPENLDVRIMEAKFALITKQYSHAFSIADSLLNLYPDELDAIKVKGKVLCEMGDYNESLKMLLKAYNKDINDASVNHFIAKNYLEFGEFEKAKMFQKSAVSLFESSDLLSFYGIIYDHQGVEDSALYYYSMAIELDSTNITPYFNRGGIYRMIKKDYDMALLDFNKTIELDSLNSVAYHERGWTHHYIGSKKRACEDWTKSYELGYDKANDRLEEFCN